MRFVVFALVAGLVVTGARAVDLRPGDLLSAADVFGNATNISVLRIDTESGDRVVISGPDGAGGVVGSGPSISRNSNRDVGLALFDGSIWVSTSGGGKYIRVDPDTGDRTIVSGCPSFSSFP